MSTALQAVFGRATPRRAEYEDYWGSIAALDQDSYFRRWLFAFCSVHTTWKYNVAAYEAIKNFREWQHDKEELRKRLIKSRAGIFNNRAEWIWKFKDDFFTYPEFYERRFGERWPIFRNRLAARISGLGMAKTSFALELAFPLEAQITCLDTHMLQLYERTFSTGPVSGAAYRDYIHTEADWLARSEALDMPPFIARQMWWDEKQGKTDSKYWSYVFE